MITIRSSIDCSESILVGLEATLTTPTGVYAISSNGPMADSHFPFGGGLFGAISWPRSRFQLAPGAVLEQQMFLPHDGSAAAFCWRLQRQSPVEVSLTIRPLFFGCSSRSYRDVGFRLQSEEEGGRLAWLPSVCGPRIIADTNGSYCDEPTRTVDDMLSASNAGNLVAPGTFGFELSERPSILILANEGHETASSRQIGAFLAALMPTRDRMRPDLVKTAAHLESYLIRAA